MHDFHIQPRWAARFLAAFFLLLPVVPAAAQEQPMVITYGVGGGWFEPATNGQGFVFDVIPASNQMVAYWFTYPQDGDGREWFIAQGDISGAREYRKCVNSTSALSAWIKQPHPLRVNRS